MPSPLTAPHPTSAKRWLFVGTILVGSFLLFLIQPMVARMALPRLGGAPAVWNSAMLVYQALLLGGYAYAHVLGHLAGRRQAVVHLLLFLVCALWLPLGLVDRVPSAAAAPELWVPWLLVLSIGPIFFVVAAQAPLMQRWYSVASGGGDPYALYAASNLGSFGGLLAYPLLVEPALPVAGQRLLWTAGYVLLALLVAGCALLLPKGGAGPTVVRPTSPSPSFGRWLHWVLLAAVPSGLMLSTTTHLTTDIVAVPLLWVIPLGLYLLSFSLAFASWRLPADIIGRVAPVALLVLAGPIFGAGSSWPLLAAGLGLLLLFVVAVALHGELHRLRPAPDRLTGFYLAMAIGGVIGGLFPALLAPALFDWTWEHVLLIFAAGLLVPLAFPVQWMRRLWGGGLRTGLLTLGVALAMALILFTVIRRLPVLGADRQIVGYVAILAIGLLCLGRRLAFAAALAAMLMLLGGYDQLMTTLKGDQRTRSYYGIYTIYDWPGGGMRLLSHGTTFHGLQLTTKGDETEPTSYYERNSGVGQAMLLAPSLYGPAARIGVVGLGTGTLACYARPGQQWTFYEIDPTVVAIARDPAKFSFLQRCLPNVPILIGDARLSLEHARPASVDLLVLDAFSSDSVPMHLLTREALAAYGRTLDRRGLLLVHISNRFLDLEPVVAAAAGEGGWHAAMLSRFNYSKDRRETLVHGSSVWIALARDPAVLARLTAGAPDWTVLTPRPGFSGWTDDFSSILPLVKAWAPDAEEKP